MEEVLGVDVDLDSERMRLSPGKRERYAAQAAEVAGRKRCSKAEYQQLLGRLQQCRGVVEHTVPICGPPVSTGWRPRRPVNQPNEGHS